MALVVMPEAINLIPETYMVEGEVTPKSCSLILHTDCGTHKDTCIYSHRHTQNQINTKRVLKD